MGDVVPLPVEEPTSPHLAGLAKCLHCKHEWAAVSPVGTYSELTCPECGLNRGIFVGTAAPGEGELWTCNCGCEVFRLKRTEFMCINCGVSQRF